jgi:uncharacterized NAD-dependent epimerase/dehydratase family protein
MNKAIVLTNGILQTSDAKTAHGLIRGTERFDICGIIDGPETAGQDAGELLDGKVRSIPIFSTLEDALNSIDSIEFLIIGIATVGGVLPESMLGIVKKGIQSGLSIVNGLHDYVQERPDLAALASEYGVQLIDIRKPKNRSQLSFWSGDIYRVKAPIIAVLGMDCAMGKRTTARMIRQASEQAGIKAEMIYTGQTGWLQGGQYGFIFDSTLNDFVSGELEKAIVTCYEEEHPDIILLEGQSALRNPSGPCGSEYFISGQAKYTVLLCAPKRKYYENEEHWGEIPSVESEIDLISKLGSNVIAVALNTEGCSRDEAYAFQKSYQERVQLPVLLPLEEGVAPILPVLQALLNL